MVDNSVPLWKQPERPLEERIDDLISRLSLEEKVSQMLYYSSAIGRLGIREYNWWNECLHGVARAGIATVFPQAIGMAASFNQDLLHRVAQVIADEARAKYNMFVEHEDRGSSRDLPSGRLTSIFSGIPLGQGPGNLRRRPLSHWAAGSGLYQWTAGGSSQVSEGSCLC